MFSAALTLGPGQGALVTAMGDESAFYSSHE